MWDEFKEKTRCLKCKSENTDAYNFYNRDEFGNLWRGVWCKDCDFMWNEVYKFSHNEDIVTCARLEK